MIDLLATVFMCGLCIGTISSGLAGTARRRARR